MPDHSEIGTINNRTPANRVEFAWFDLRPPVWEHGRTRMNSCPAQCASKLALLTVFLACFTAVAQTNPAAASHRMAMNSNSPAPTVAPDPNQGLALAQRVEAMRAECIQNRRLICGKILKVLPEGLVVDSGYTNLLRAPLNQSWLIPGTAVANRATNLVEDNKPDSLCVGLVFLTDLPKSPAAKPKVFDYVNVEGFPMGQYTYVSVGDLRRTVRQFTTKVANSVRWNFEESAKEKPGQTNTPAK